MFTGIVKDIGEIKHIETVGEGLRFSIHFRNQSFNDINIDESICVSGVCLTVTHVTREQKLFMVDVVQETLSKTTLSEWTTQTSVNLERALRLHDRLGGGWTLGHVDTIATITSIAYKELSSEIWIEVEESYQPLLIHAGSITLDGVSLTLAEIRGNSAKIAIIPYTLKHTTFQQKKAGEKVNAEFDAIGKYVVNYLKSNNNKR